MKMKSTSTRSNMAWLVAGLLLLPLATQANAKDFRWKFQEPPKDCTRINGRWGYYGNPWCNKDEQLRWDHWEAARLARRLGG